MTNSTRVAPPCALILVADPSNSEVPSKMSGALIASTDSCIAVGCRSDADGDTEFTLGAAREVDPGYQPHFQGKLKTPSQRIALRSVLGQTILEEVVPSPETYVRVWINDPNEPDRVIVGTE